MSMIGLDSHGDGGACDALGLCGIERMGLLHRAEFGCILRRAKVKRESCAPPTTGRPHGARCLRGS